MSSTMKALKFHGNGRMSIENVEKPKAQNDWVVVRVTASGICGTDIELLLHAKEGSPVTPGHEVAGVVCETDKAKRFKTGDRVLINCHVTCGVCEHCNNGDLIFCPELKAVGFEIDGGNAEYLLVPEASLRPIPDDISDEVAVVIGDALGTPYSAIKKADIAPGDFVGVFGAGPLGIMAIFTAAQKGGRVVAVDMNESRLEKSREFGAEFTVNPKDADALDKIRQITGGKGLDSVIQCSPSGAAIALGLDALKLRGRLIQVGVVTNLSIDIYSKLNLKELSMIGSRNFNDRDTKELIAFVKAHPEVEKLISHRFSLGDAEEAFALAEKGDCVKIVIKP